MWMDSLGQLTTTYSKHEKNLPTDDVFYVGVFSDILSGSLFNKHSDIASNIPSVIYADRLFGISLPIYTFDLTYI